MDHDLPAAVSPQLAAFGRRDWSVLLAVLAVVALPYLQTYDDALIAFDDASYLGPGIRGGFSWASLRWAFGYHEANWHPLTWLSHMLDWRLSPWNAGLFKLHNLLLHLGSVGMFFLFLRRAGEPAAAAALASLVFGVHPLRVVSVAWVAERKDCLCVFFCVATMLAYQRYAVRRTAAGYVLVTAAIALAMLAKPLAVTLPVGLAVLDLWPLGRLDPRRPRSWAGLVAEKLPWLGMSAGLALITMHAHASAGAVDRAAPLEWRLQQTVMSYGIYLGQLFVVGGHSVLYPIPVNPWLPLWRVLATLALLVGVTAVAAANVVRRPWLAAGWAWFLLLTFPMSGIVAIGEHSRADRYTYLPHLLLIAAIVHQLWQFGWLAAPQAAIRRPAQALVLVYLAGLFLTTWNWVACWHDSERVILRSLEATGPNAPLLRMLGTYYDMTDEPAAAITCFELAIEHGPREVDARALLVRRLVRAGRTAEAERGFAALVHDAPDIAGEVAEKLWEWDAIDHAPADRLVFIWRYVLSAAEAAGDVARAQEATRRINRDA
jgi:hypothetical protein